MLSPRIAGRPGYAKREEWIAEQTSVALPGATVSKTTRAKLTTYAILHARAQLRAAGTRPPTDHEALLAAYLDHAERRCAHCGQPLAGKQRKYCSIAHGRAVEARRRQRHKRERTLETAAAKTSRVKP